MSRPTDFRLGDLQLRIMKVLWERAAAGVAEVHQAPGGDPGLAYATRPRRRGRSTRHQAAGVARLRA
jgi:hypothetical protein